MKVTKYRHFQKVGVQGGDVVVSASGNWCSGGIKNDGSPSCGGPGGIRPPNPGESGDLLVPSAKIGVLVQNTTEDDNGATLREVIV